MSKRETATGETTRPAGGDAALSEAELLADLQRVDEETRGTVSEREYADRGEYGVTTFRRRFGSWNAAKRRAELETERPVCAAESMADDVVRVAGELDGTYVTPAQYAERGTYPLAALPTDEGFWEDLRERIGLAVRPLYHKVTSAATDEAES